METTEQLSTDPADVEHSGNTVWQTHNARIYGQQYSIESQNNRELPDDSEDESCDDVLQELREIDVSLNQQNDKIEVQKKKNDEYHSLNDSYHDRITKEFHALRAEIRSCLVETGKTVLEEAKELRDRNKKEIDARAETLTKMFQEDKLLLSEMNTQKTLQQKEKENTFILVKRAEKQITEHRQILDISKTDRPTERYTFEGNHDLKYALDNRADIARLRVWSDVAKCSRVMKLKPARKFSLFKKKIKCSDIVGIIITPQSNLMAVDAQQGSLQQLDLAKDKFVQEKSLGSKPNGITMIPGQPMLAVAMPELHQIQFFGTESDLVLHETVDVDGQCLAVASMREMLVVSFQDPGKVQVIDQKGTVFKTVSTDTTGDALFQTPRHICLSSDNDIIYVSDEDKDTVTSIGTDGTIHWQYKDDDLTSPQGLDTGADTCLYICSENTHSIHVVSPRGIKLTIISTQVFGLSSPKALHCNEAESSLYVSSGSANCKESKLVRQLTFE